MDDEMVIPFGLVCGDCYLFSRCSRIIGVLATNRECDFHPVKFSPSARLYAVLKENQDLRSQQEVPDASPTPLS